MTQTKIRIAATLLAAALAAATLVGCTTATSPSPTASVDVLAELAATLAGLDDALAKYEVGDSAGAEQAAGDAYLEHFELVERPLEEQDRELTEELEHLIRDELREAIRAGRPVDEVRALIDEARAGLARAEELLR